jgi:hypothetical protein
MTKEERNLLLTIFCAAAGGEKPAEGRAPTPFAIKAEHFHEIRNTAIEDCAKAIEEDALRNDLEANNKHNSLQMRAHAEQAAATKHTCAFMLRGMKR